MRQSRLTRIASLRNNVFFSAAKRAAGPKIGGECPPEHRGPLKKDVRAGPTIQRPKVFLLPNARPGSAEAWSLVAYASMHLLVGLGFNPRVPVDHRLLRWLLDSAGAGTGGPWMWRLVAGAYCLVVAASHPEAEAWARLPPAARAAAESADPDGLIGARKWYDGLLRPGEGDGGGAGEPDAATRLISWETAETFLGKIGWLDTDEGRRLATRVWRDAQRQPYGFMQLL